MGETIQVEVSSLPYYAFAGVAAGLALESPVRLVREPANAWDANAIRVELEDGTHLGYVEKGVNERLAALLDPRGGTATAFIAAIEGGAHAEQLRLRVAFPLPEDAADPWGDSVSGYCFQPGYVLLDCARATLARVREALGPLAGAEPYVGASTKPAPDGRRYRWFVRLEPATGGDGRAGGGGGPAHGGALRRQVARAAPARGACGRAGEVPARARVRARVEGEGRRAGRGPGGVGVLPARPPRATGATRTRRRARRRSCATGSWPWRRRSRAAAAAPRSCSGTSTSRSGPARTWRRRPEPGAATGDARRASERLSLEQVGFVLEHACPPLQLLRDSEEAIAGLPKQGALLRELSRLDEPEVKGERVEGAPGWCERHFTTGHGNDGRLYYRRRGDRFEVLVSLKQTQTRDVRYLAGL